MASEHQLTALSGAQLKKPPYGGKTLWNLVTGSTVQFKQSKVYYAIFPGLRAFQDKFSLYLNFALNVSCRT